MNPAFNDLIAEAPKEDFSPLEPKAKFFAAMDCLIYLTEDKSYRAVRLSPLVTVLLDPHQDYAIGIKIKGVREMVEAVTAFLRGQEIVQPSFKLIAVLEYALTLGLGDHLMAEADAQRRKRYEPDVRRLARQAGEFSIGDIRVAA